MSEISQANAQLSAESLPAKWIEKLFNVMEDRYGALWADRYGAFPRDRVMQTWGRDLADMGRADLARGVESSRSCKYPPTLPEFREMCRPAIDHERAYHEAVEQMQRRDRGADTWSHPAIFWASCEIGDFDLRNSSWNSIKSRWVSVFNSQMARKQWPEVPPRCDALPAPGAGSIPVDEAHRRIDAMRKILESKMVTE